jgi:hypothetical protein
MPHAHFLLSLSISLYPPLSLSLPLSPFSLPTCLFTLRFTVSIEYQRTAFGVTSEVTQDAIKKEASLRIAVSHPIALSRFGDLFLHENSPIQDRTITFNASAYNALIIRLQPPSGELYELHNHEGIDAFFEVDIILRNTSLPSFAANASSDVVFTSVSFVDPKDSLGRIVSFDRGWFLSDDLSSFDRVSHSMRIKGHSKAITQAFTFTAIEVTLNYPLSFPVSGGAADMVYCRVDTALSVVGFRYYFLDSIAWSSDIPVAGRSGFVALVDNEPPSFNYTCPSNIVSHALIPRIILLCFSPI